MKVRGLIAELLKLDPDTPVSHELLAELAPVDEAIYQAGQSNFHPSIHFFRKQRYLRAAVAARNAITMLRQIGLDARVARKSLRSERHFVECIDFVITPNVLGADHVPFCGTRAQERDAEALIADVMLGWPYSVTAVCFIVEDAHRKYFDDALRLEDLPDVADGNNAS